jgi:hypothetical protein
MRKLFNHITIIVQCITTGSINFHGRNGSRMPWQKLKWLPHLEKEFGLDD